MTVQLEAFDLTKIYTVEEFMNLDLPEDEDFELLGGHIVAKPGTTSALHGDIASRISTALSNFAGFSSNQPKGRVYVGSSTTLGQPVSKSTFMPKPDVCFVLSLEKFEDIITVVPDIVVEVNSPSDTDERRFQKLQAYQQAGVKLFWSVNILEKFVMVYKAGESDPGLVTFNGVLDGGEVLPGFKLPVKALFD